MGIPASLGLLLAFGASALGLGAATAAEPDAVYGRPVPPAESVSRRGTDQFIGGVPEQAVEFRPGVVSLNLVEVPIAVAAKAVLTDALGWGYTLDERASGTITLQTAGPVRREILLRMFESALSSRNLTLRRRGTTAQIVPAGPATGAVPVQGLGAAGGGAQAVPLRWIAAAEMQAILSSVAPRDVVLRVDRVRNLLILSGDAAQIEALRQTISVFDVDWMRGMSTAILPVRSANPAAMARNLTQIFGGETAGTGDIIRFVPNEALGAVLVISTRAAYLDRARDWAARLESVAADRERQLFVYRIQNRSAKELAAVLQGVIAAEMGGGANAGGYGGGGYGGAAYGGLGAGGLGAGGLGAYGGGGGGYGGAGLGAPGLGAPGLGAAGLGAAGFGAAGAGASGFGGAGAGFPGAGGASGAGGFGGEAGGAGAGGIGATATGAGGFGGGAGAAGFGGGGGEAWGGSPATGGGVFGAAGHEGGYGGGAGYAGQAAHAGAIIGVVADDANNSLVISATRTQYDKLLRILASLDAMPTQVLLETVIAEVTLNNELQFGVQWFLKNQGSRFNLTQAATIGAASAATGGTAGLIAAATRGVTGFNYLFNNPDFSVVLNALQGITRVNVISSPNITVLDNRTAKLQIGDQVPIVKQTGQSALAGNAPILNQIEMKDTGVILSVTPRVNKNGLVVLDINQEVSDVVPTTTSTINSPTIRQRRVATSIAVHDGHSLAIGGLVQERALITNESLPVLGDLPLIGPAFRNRIDSRIRTELIIFIRPRVIRGTVDADRISQDFRAQLRTMMPVRPVPAPMPMAAAPAGPPGFLRRMVD